MSQISWQDLEAYHGEYVEIKGFLFKDGQDCWFLSNNPQLKSCCVGTQNFPQIRIANPVIPPSSFRAVKMCGLLQKTSEEKVFFCLSEAKIVKNSFLPLYGFVTFLFIFIFFLIRWRKKRIKL